MVLLVTASVPWSRSLRALCARRASPNEPLPWVWSSMGCFTTKSAAPKSEDAPVPSALRLQRYHQQDGRVLRVLLSVLVALLPCVHHQDSALRQPEREAVSRWRSCLRTHLLSMPEQGSRVESMALTVGTLAPMRWRARPQPSKLLLSDKSQQFLFLPLRCSNSQREWALQACFASWLAAALSVLAWRTLQQPHSGRRGATWCTPRNRSWLRK